MPPTIFDAIEESGELEEGDGENGSSEPEIRELAWQLLSKRVDPYVSLKLVAAFNECYARPPMGQEALLEAVDEVSSEFVERST